jgi:hypothetical protein
MYFTEEAPKDLAREYENIARKHAALMQAYLTRQYREERGKEFAQHGADRSMHFTRCNDSVLQSMTSQSGHGTVLHLMTLASSLCWNV